MPGRGARSGVDARRAAAVLLLVAAAAVGLRAGGAFSAAGPGFLGMSGHALYGTLAVVEAILAVAGLILLIAGYVLSRRDGVGERKRRSIWWVLLLPIVTFGLARILPKLRRHAAARHGPGSGAVRGAGAAHAHTAPPGSPWTLLALVAALALVAGMLTAYRRRRELASREPEPGPAVEPLAEALAAGAEALQQDPHPRTAIIGCYAAMERTLADAGSPAEAADTPAEVLARATEGGLVGSVSADTLTELFRLARYSRRPMTEADRTAAQGALAQVRADLEAGTGAGLEAAT